MIVTITIAYALLLYTASFGRLSLLWTFISGALVFYATHRYGHSKPGLMAWYKAHVIGHHYFAYPPSRPFRLAPYVNNKVDVWRLNTFVYVVTGLMHVTFCTWWFQFTLSTVAYIVTVELLLLLVEEVVHRRLHTSPLPQASSYGIVHFLAQCHEAHHERLNVNYAVVALWTDILCGTFFS